MKERQFASPEWVLPEDSAICIFMLHGKDIQNVKKDADCSFQTERNEQLSKVFSLIIYLAELGKLRFEQV